MNELAIQRGIVTYLRSLGIPHSVTNVSCTRRRGRGQRVTKGWPDITGVLPPSGRAVFIEVKTDKGVVSEVQMDLHDTLRSAGALVIVARCVSDVSEALWEEERRKSVLSDRNGIQGDPETPDQDGR